MASYFDDTSMLRRVHREQAVALGGPRALLMMAAHPVAFEGFFMSTGALGDPYARLQRTANVLGAIAWRDRAEADRLTRRVRSMHGKVRGELHEPAGPFPAGTTYAADDPGLLLWILACLVDSSLLAYERYVRGLEEDERDAYWADYRLVGRLFGIPDEAMPGDWAGIRAYMDERLGSDELVVTPKARELGIDIVMRPPVPLAARPLVETVNQITIGLLPSRVRKGYGLRWDPVRGLAVRGGQEYARRVLVPLLPERWRLVPSARALRAAA
ncbi:oxygenase MpaB family protein [Conexibacter sp. SYSU D00693]|uniref:oxygenase MpaB family protein n=1 Tax=Conexibacter sp. SYSU D00693 TaxID=2812560 RepID=UPI00196A90F3|nr:oxygenase MpaB family protein [Conexibacter sp. SYSU D00693]